MFPEVVLNVFQRSFRSRKRASSINSSKSHGSEDASAAPSRLPTPELPADASALQKGACIVQTKADGFLENLTRFAEHVDENDAPEDGDQVLVDSDSWDHSGHKLDPILESSLSDVKMQEAADLQGQERSVLGPSTPSMRATSPYPPEQKSATHNQFLAYSPVIQSHPNSSSDSSLFVHLASPPTQFCTTPEMAIIEEIAGTTKPQDGQHVAARWTTMEAAATEKASASATKLSFTSFGSSCPDSHNEMESSPLHTSHSLEDEVSMTQEADVPLQSVSGPPSPETGELIMPYLVTPCKANVLEIASPLLEDEFSLRVAENVIEPLGVPLPTTYAEATNVSGSPFMSSVASGTSSVSISQPV
ncbi:hypothetical protein B0H21DRAFT_707794 [Amylocystis lapponica]|nr:hypothetical protein B0H21DRAFT_707794 [Amylocystis lapponica]